MHTIANLLALSGKVVLGYLFIFCVCTVLFIVGLLGIGNFVLLLFVCAALYYGSRYAYRRWPNHRIFKSTALWQFGLIAALVMSLAGFAYGLIHNGVR